jgi:CopA family copper-resistance protein
MNRRQLLKNGVGAASVVGLQGLFPLWARSVGTRAHKGIVPLSGTEFHLEVAHTEAMINGSIGKAITINGQLPGPLLRWREGDDIALHVTNRLEEDTSIHWHGILVPFTMDGVPGVSFPGIRPRETFTYRFRVPQNGTYWYHSHSGLQEQAGHYGPIVIEPHGADPVQFDREHIVVLSDWTFSSPERIFTKLKKMSDNFNFQKRTAGEFLRDVSEDGLGSTIKDRLRWGRMRMAPTDFLDVTGAEYTYLVNGHAPDENWTALFEPGQRTRLRIINASAMTIFDVRIPGLPMTVVHVDGLNVRPLETDEFQIGVAETYDVIVQPERSEAYTLMCEAMDRSGYGRATLAPRVGMEGVVPPRRKRPLLTMRDMGMAHGSMHGGDGQMNGGAEEAPHDAGKRDAGMHDSGMHDAGMEDSRMPRSEHESGMAAKQMHPHAKGPGVQNLAMHPTKRIDEPGIGLENVPHRALTYGQLRALDPNPDSRPPGRELEVHLTSNMERYMFSFDGKKFSDNVAPIVFYKDERVRLTMVNDTMMSHPIHLHGMFFDVVNEAGNHKVRKHTIIVRPAEKVSIDITADAMGDWAFHCHLLYHMHAGMFQVVSVREPESADRR